jgi:hypothetical protein
MKIIEKLLARFNGLHYRQEYLCLALEDLSEPLNVYAVRKQGELINLTAHHLFVGYCPVIIALPFMVDEKNRLQLVFCLKVFNENETLDKEDVLAELFLQKIEERNVNGTDIFFYRASSGRHEFLPSINQWIISLNNLLSGKKAGNVFLKGNLLKQVQIAYSVPRKICLVTVGSNGIYNLFPTDLHGQVNEQIYIISLRYNGKACEQVLESENILLSDIEPGAFKKVYLLGKNHMQPLKPRSAFEFSHLDSAQFHLPLPQHTVAYKELALTGSFVEGIHRLLVFQIRNEVKMEGNSGSLSHIHTVYATWRENKGLRSNYLLR